MDSNEDGLVHPVPHSVELMLRISSSADMIGADLLATLGGERGEKMSKSYKERSMSPNISSLLLE